MLMYAAWLEGATDSDIHAIKQTIGKKTRRACCISGFSYCNFFDNRGVRKSPCGTNHDSSPQVARVWQ